MIFEYSLINIQNQRKQDDIDLYTIYSQKNKTYFSYQTATANCREIYSDPKDSQFKLIRVNEIDKDLYFIQNGYKDQRLNYWLGFEMNESKNKYQVKMYENEEKKAIWKLEPQPMDLKKEGLDDNVDGVMVFKIYGYYDGEYEKGGWLYSDKKDGSWNYLCFDESDALLYSPRLLSIYHI